jgi:hypothetical protein
VLWLALFDLHDLRTDVLPSDDGEDVRECAPLTRKVDALARFEGAVARIEKAYPRIGTLRAHAAPLRSMLNSARGRFVTIELDEIAWLARSRSGFDKRLSRALEYLSGSDIPRISRTLTSLSGVDPSRPLIPPTELFARSRPLKADLFQCMRVVGTSFLRDVPWEDAPEKQTKQRAPKLHQQLHEALEAGNEELARDLLERGANPNTTGGRDGLCCTMDYVRFGKVSFDMGHALVAAGFDLTKRRQGYTPLQRAIWHDQVDVVSGLLDLGASATQKDSFGRLPLSLAAHAGAVRCVELFLPDADDKAIRTAIRAAEKRLAKPNVPPIAASEQRRIRRTIERLRAVLGNSE